jgi:hypothetical protein
MAELHVITTIFSPAGYQSRFKLHEDFRRRMEASGACLYTIELANGDQPFAVTQPDDPRHFQVRSDHVLWFRENLFNVACARLPPDWKYVAIIDDDIALLRPDWIEATLDALQRHAFVQMFSHVLDLGPKFEPIGGYEGFAYRHRKRDLAAGIGQTGFAWAARREALEAVGGVIDWSILGANDYYMALALVGAVDERDTRMPGSSYAHSLLEWQHRAEEHVRRDIGYVESTLVHYWHGPRKDRGYDTRWRILVDHQFDPRVDLRKDAQGLLELTGQKPGLRDAIRAYFNARNEDAAEV